MSDNHLSDSISKDSNLERTPKDWATRPLGAITRIRRGASPRPIDSPIWFSDNGPGWIRIADVTRSKDRLRETEQHLSLLGASKSVAVHPGQVIMSIAATIGEPIILDIEACIHDGFVVFDQYEQHLSADFLVHFLRFSQGYFRSQGQTGTQANLNTGIVKRYIISLPPLPEQRRIAEMLDTVDAAIQQTEALIAKLKLMKAGLLHDLLTLGLDEQGQLRDPITHPEQFKDSPLGRIPREWGAVPIDFIAVYVGSGITPLGGSKVYVQDGVPLIRSQNVTFDGLLLDDVAYIDAKTHQSMRRSEIFPHDVLINITGASIGRCCPVPDDLGEANVNQHVCAIRSHNPSREDAIFLSAALASYIGQSQIKRLNAGSNREGINYQQLRAIVVPWPTESERRKIAITFVAHDARIRAEEAYGDKLKQLKKGLMRDLLTGRVRVQAAEAAQ
jgi:type I restriction enzyme S subunit